MGFAPQLHYVKNIPKKSSSNWRTTLGVRENTYWLIKGSPRQKKSNTKYHFKGSTDGNKPMKSMQDSKFYTQLALPKRKRTGDSSPNIDYLPTESYSNLETIPVKKLYVRSENDNSKQIKSNILQGAQLNETYNTLRSRVKTKPVENILNIDPYPPDLWK